MASRFSTREEYLLAAVREFTPLFVGLGYKVPPIRVSTGWPSSRAVSQKVKALGECWDKSASADSVAQIFISPWLGDLFNSESKDAKGVLPTLVHEMVHAVLGNKEKHNKVFRKCALAVGLEGSMTATNAGEALLERCRQVAETLGEYPHAKLEPSLSGRKKQGTRMIKCECGCGFTVRTSRKWLDEVGAPHCPKHGAMSFELPDESDSDAEEDED